MVARSYDKFFNLEEVPMTEMENLRSTFQYPLIAYVKENGYLGIMSGVHNAATNTYSLFTASKSTNVASYANEFRKLVLAQLESKNISETQLAKELFDRRISMVFEVIIPNFDPHIIKYDKATLVLLDVVENNLLKFIRYNQEQRYTYSSQLYLSKLEKNWQQTMDLFVKNAMPCSIHGKTLKNGTKWLAIQNLL